MDTLFTSIDRNIDKLKTIFTDCDDIIFREFNFGENKSIRGFMAYVDNIVSTDVIENPVLTNLLTRTNISPGDNIAARALEQVIAVGEADFVYDFKAVCDAMLIGDTVVIIDGDPRGIVVSTKSWPTRGVPDAETEVVVQGPKDAFCESASINTVLVRRRIRDTRLKVLRKTAGRSSNSTIIVMYMDGIARKQIIDEVVQSIDNVKTDIIPDSGYFVQLTEKDVFTPFPTMQLTERPDKAAASISEGRVVVIVDNTPFAIVVPATLNVFFQSAEDYYDNWEIMSFLRILRYIAAVIAVCLPGFYVALTVYHPSVIPTALALKIASSRGNVPFPTVVEVLIMELAFELLREAGIRLPSPVSSTIGIVGGIIIGQSAVEAGLVGPAVVIVSALAGICSFVVPSVAFVSAMRIIKYFVLILSSALGLFGFWVSLVVIIVHLCSIKTFGIPYLFPFCSGSVNGWSDLKDSIIRAPMFMMKKRPFFAARKAWNKEDEK